MPEASIINSLLVSIHRFVWNSVKLIEIHKCIFFMFYVQYVSQFDYDYKGL